MNPTYTTTRLTKAQKKLLDKLWAAGGAGIESPCGLGRRSGVIASGWHRTVDSLVALGLARKVRTGDIYIARHVRCSGEESKQ